MNRTNHTITITEDIHPEASGYPESSPERNLVNAILNARDMLERTQRDGRRS